ncbi:MAG: complex I subunit 1 family protein [Desulfurococcaceae archaeon]
METILLIFFTLLVFPGLLFVISLSFLTQYLVRKITARFQRRMGPSYAGPAGTLQPFMDFLKLLRTKEVVKSPYSMVTVAEISLLLGVSFIISSVLLLPLGFLRLSSSFDILVFFYMTSVMPLFMLIIASLSMPNPYTNIGVSRLLTLSTIVEPTYFASVLIPIYVATRGKEPFLSITTAYANIPSLWFNTSGIVLALCLIAFIVTVQAKAMYPPFNIPEAEQEIIAGFETEFS